VLSDNGHAKGTTYEWGVRTLLSVRYPNGGVAAGRVVSDLVSTIDLVPTVLDLAGVRGTYDTDGRSWAPLLNGSAASLGRAEIFVEIDFDVAVVRPDGLKLVHQDAANPNRLATSGIYASTPTGSSSTSSTT